jgi:hypothetical protein
MKSIEQKKFMQGRKKVEILEQGRVRVTHSSMKGKNEEVFNLFDLDYQSDKYFHRPLKFLVMAVIFSVPSIPFLVEALKNLDLVPFYVSLIFLVPALICIQQYFYKITDLVVYRFHGNGNAAITLWSRLPNERELSEFLTTLTAEIRNLRIRPDLDNAKKLEIYKNNLEFLLEEGVINQDEAISIYERNKERLLGNEKAKLFSIQSSNN